MGRRFGWFAAGAIAAVAAAAGAAAYAATPLATLRQAVMPAPEPVPPTFPIVTTAPVEMAPRKTAPDLLEGPPPAPADSGPAEPVPFVFAAPLDSGWLEPVHRDPPGLQPANGGSASAIAVTAPADSIVALAAPAVAPPTQPAIAPLEVPAPIERLPADIAGAGREFDEDPTYRKPLSAIRVDVAPTQGILPPNEAAAYFAGAAAQQVVPRGEQETLFFWQATNLCHRPLYFQQNYLERDGRSFGPVQPIVSGAQFFGSVPLLPYRMVRQPPCRCIYTLGESRPDGYGRRRDSK